jgi:hypothetical protein
MHHAHALDSRSSFAIQAGHGEDALQGEPEQKRSGASLHAWASCYRSLAMNHDLISGTRLLGKGHIRHVRAQRGRRVELLSGSLWITQDGDRRDIVLAAGEAFDFDRGGDALLSAFADSRYLLLDAEGAY